jgi:hypothetical protein
MSSAQIDHELSRKSSTNPQLTLIRVISIPALQIDRIHSLAHNGQYPECQGRANRVHDEHPRHTAIRIDDDIAVLEDEEQHDNRPDREQDVDGQLQDVAALGLLREVDDLVGERQHRVDEQAEAEPGGAQFKIQKLAVPARLEAVAVRDGLDGAHHEVGNWNLNGDVTVGRSTKLER